MPMSITESGPSEHGPRLIVPIFEDAPRPEHVYEMQELGVTTVLACITEADIVGGQRTKVWRSTIAAAHELDMDVWTDPWGVANIFGGEAPSSFNLRDSHLANPAVRKTIQKGIRMASDLGATCMFWDEVNLEHAGYTPEDEVAFIREVAAYADDLSLKNAVCLTSNPANMDKLRQLATDEHIQGVGTDPYYSNYPGDNPTNPDDPRSYVGKYASQIHAMEKEFGVEGHVWVQGFHLPLWPNDRLDISYENLMHMAERRQWWNVPLMAARAAIDEGIRSIGFWGSLRWEAANTEDFVPPHKVQVFDNIKFIRQKLEEAAPHTA